MASEARFAVLIDADNISVKYIKSILDEISGLGTITYKRIYGDWTSPTLVSWKPVLLEHSILPIQQYGYTVGKNATDSAMIIDAMDILYSENVEGFCLVSSDSDFTRLAARLRESGKYVMGMGERKTPSAFISACNNFKYLEILEQPAVPEAVRGKTAKTAVPVTPAEESQMTDLDTIHQAVKTILDSSDEEEVLIGDIGNRLSKRFPDFDVRNYGFRKLTPFIKSLGVGEVGARRAPDGNSKIVFVKNTGTANGK